MKAILLYILFQIIHILANAGGIGINWDGWGIVNNARTTIMWKEVQQKSSIMIRKSLYCLFLFRGNQLVQSYIVLHIKC